MGRKLTKDTPIKFSYKMKIMPKQLPEKWYNLYRLRYSKYSNFYKKNRGLLNPMFDVLVEKIAFLSVFLLYIESPDYGKNPETGKSDGTVSMLNPLYLEDYVKAVAGLNKVMEQMMKYTEVKIIQKETHDIPIRPKEIASGELDNRITELIQKGKGRISITATGTRT